MNLGSETKLRHRKRNIVRRVGIGLSDASRAFKEAERRRTAAKAREQVAAEAELERQAAEKARRIRNAIIRSRRKK